MITIVSWERYAINVKQFKNLKEAKDYIKANPNMAIAVIRGKLVFRTSGVNLK